MERQRKERRRRTVCHTEETRREALPGADPVAGAEDMATARCMPGRHQVPAGTAVGNRLRAGPVRPAEGCLRRVRLAVLETGIRAERCWLGGVTWLAKRDIGIRRPEDTM